MIEKDIHSRLEIKPAIGDAAYSEEGDIKYSQENNILVAKLNPAVSFGCRKKENGFEFNSDAGMYVGKAAHMAIRKAK